MRIAALLLAAMAASNASAALTDWDWLTQYKQPNMHYGQLALHPYYKLSEEYDSNIYLVPPDQPGGQIGSGLRSSWITKNDLGLEANLPWHHIDDLSVGYDFDWDKYTTQPSINDTVNQAAHADFSREGARGMTYRLGDRYINTTDQAFSELTQRERRWMNRVYAGVDYAPKNGRLVGGVDADQETDKYLDATLGGQLNRYEQDAGFNVGYLIQPKTKAYVSYRRGIIHYTVDPSPGAVEKDNKAHTVSVGVSGKLSPKIDGRVEGGMTYREYDVAPIAGAPRVHRSPTVATAVTYRPDGSSSIALTLSRYLQESIYAQDPFYYANIASLALEHKLPYKLTVGVNAAVEIDQYSDTQAFGSSTGTRRDDLYQGGLSLTYEIQAWLSTSLAYFYRERDSTLSAQFNYQDSQVLWNAALKF